jgi:uncharacterized alkaline shock family protein YloU
MVGEGVMDGVSVKVGTRVSVMVGVNVSVDAGVSVGTSTVTVEVSVGEGALANYAKIKAAQAEEQHDGISFHFSLFVSC